MNALRMMDYLMASFMNRGNRSVRHLIYLSISYNWRRFARLFFGMHSNKYRPITNSCLFAF